MENMEQLPLALLHEVRDDVKKLSQSFSDFKNQVVTKRELQMWEDAKKTTIRWAIGTVIAVGMLLVAFTAIIIQTRGG